MPADKNAEEIELNENDEQENEPDYVTDKHVHAKRGRPKDPSLSRIKKKSENARERTKNWCERNPSKKKLKEFKKLAIAIE
uniref:Uncharacterized protein n=1 Tax=Acrobeloides nanus TaxID=290746 RepID=A0A914DUJ3_9BILA